MQISELTNFKGSLSPLPTAKPCPSQKGNKIFITKTEIWQKSEDLHRSKLFHHSGLSSDTKVTEDLDRLTSKTAKAEEGSYGRDLRTGSTRRSVLTHKSYQPYQSSSKSNENINPLIDMRVESRIKSFKVKAVKDSISTIALQKKLQDWARIKTRLIEDVQVKLDTRARSKVIERKLQTHDSDDEDFQYAFISKVGRVRKFKSSLIGVAKHPNTYESGKDGSIVKQFEGLPDVSRSPDCFGDFEEALKIKLSLARKGIRSNFIDISNQITFPTFSTGLPRGGENLIKISRKISCNT